MAVQMLRVIPRLLLLGSVASPAWAADVVTASGLGTGLTRGTLREPWTLANAPAVLALSARYDLSASGTLTPGLGWGGNVAAVDSRTGPVAMGFGFEYGQTSPPPTGEELPGWLPEDEDPLNAVTEWSLTGGAGVGFFDRRFSVGALGFRRWRDATYTREDVYWDAGLSLAGRPVAPLVLSANARRVAWLATQDEDHPMELSFGAGYEPVEAFTLGAEASLELDDPALSWRAGLEGRVAQQKLPLRLGLAQDAELDTWFVSAGLGIWTGRAGLDYGARVDIGPDGGAAEITGTRSWHTLSARFAL